MKKVSREKSFKRDTEKKRTHSNYSVMYQPENNFEYKYLVTRWQAESVIDFLNHQCVLDPLYPEYVATVYYDSRDLDLYYEKIDSDYIKNKIRLRFYHNPRKLKEMKGAIPCFLEIKRKIGRRRQKVRKKIAADPKGILPLHNNLMLEEIGSLCRELGMPPPFPDLLPVVLVNYYRYKYLDGRSGLVITVDKEIEVFAANEHMFLTKELPSNLKACVVEVKGDSPKLPEVLKPISSTLQRREAFSKYGYGVQLVRSMISGFDQDMGV